MDNETRDKRKEWEAFVNTCEFRDTDEVAEYFEKYTQLIHDYKMIGRIYDCYDDDIVMNRSSGVKIQGLTNIFGRSMQLLTTVPDLQYEFLDIFAEGNPEDGYSFAQLTVNHGTFSGYSRAGEPSGRNYDDPFPKYGICECFVEKVDGRWMITREWVGDSEFYDDYLLGITDTLDGSRVDTELKETGEEEAVDA